MRGLLVALTFALSACATAATAPINAPLGGLRADVVGREATGEDIIVLALSGGGARAASFHLGVLYGLRETRGRDGLPLSQHIAVMTSVSGGSLVAAHYWLHGDSGLDDFDEFYLDRSRRWRVRGLGSAAGISAALGGGANGPEQLSQWLTTNVYGGATMGTTGQGPRVIINATDIYNSTPFAFTQFFFDGICSDVRQVSVADAVAASMAVPVAFRPVLVESYGSRCERTPDWVPRVLDQRDASENVRQTARAFLNYRGDTNAGQRYVHLSDGGVADNLGLLSLQVMRAGEGPPFPLTAGEALRARRVLVLVVNAEYIRPRTFQREGTDAIGAQEMIYAPLDVSTEVAKRASLDVFREQLPALERDLRAWRCDQPQRAAEAGWNCNDLSVSMDVITFRDMTPAEYDALYDTPTELALPPETTRALIEAGRGVVARNAAIAELRGD